METDSTQSKEEPRGRTATSPSEIPGRGWIDVAWRVKNEIAADKVTFTAGGVAFFAMLGLLPGVVALISIYGLFADPAAIEDQMSTLQSIVPADALDLLTTQMADVSSRDTVVGFSALFGIIVAWWSASKAVDGVMTALNIVYDEKEKRGWFKRKATALAMTLSATLALIISILLVVVVPVVVDKLGLQTVTHYIALLIRWALLIFLAMTGFAAVYRWAPSREDAKWKWVTWGSGIATGLWLIASALFSLYLSHFNNYNELYGSMGAVIILLIWLYVSAFVLLLGGEINAEIEHQTLRDTTTGEPEPIGRRGAHVADTVGKTH